MTKQVDDAPRTKVRGLETYHVWFSPKKRKAALQGDIDAFVRDCLASISEQRGIRLLEVETRYDHVHLLLQPPAGMRLATAMQYLKGASARYVFQTFNELKMDLGHDHFWQRGYAYRQVAPAGIARVAKYIRNHRTHEDLEPRTSVRGTELPPVPGTESRLLCGTESRPLAKGAKP